MLYIFFLNLKLGTNLHISSQIYFEQAKMDSTSQTSTVDDAKIQSDLFNLVEKLQIELHKKDQELQKKDEELAKERQEKQKLAARANRADKFEMKWTSANLMIDILQLELWKSFPSNSCCYHIDVVMVMPSGLEHHLYVDTAGQLTSSWPYAAQPSQLKFTKNSNGTFSIYSINKGKYLQTSSNYSRVIFSAIDEDSAGQFVIFFHPQRQQTGLLVDISSLAGSYLCVDNFDFAVANSRTPPANKFLISPADE